MLSRLEELAADSAKVQAFADAHATVDAAGAVDQMPLRMTDVDVVADTLIGPDVAAQEQPRIRYEGGAKRTRFSLFRGSPKPERESPPPAVAALEQDASAADSDAAGIEPPQTAAATGQVSAPSGAQASVHDAAKSPDTAAVARSARQRNYAPVFGATVLMLLAIAAMVAFMGPRKPPSASDVREAVAKTLEVRPPAVGVDPPPQVAVPEVRAAPTPPVPRTGDERYNAMLEDIKGGKVLGASAPMEPAPLPDSPRREVRAALSLPAAAPAVPTKRIGLIVEGADPQLVATPQRRDPIAAHGVVASLSMLAEHAPAHRVLRIESVDGDLLAYVVRHGQPVSTGHWVAAGDALPDGWHVASLSAAVLTLSGPQGQVAQLAREPR